MKSATILLVTENSPPFAFLYLPHPSLFIIKETSVEFEIQNTFCNPECYGWINFPRQGVCTASVFILQSVCEQIKSLKVLFLYYTALSWPGGGGSGTFYLWKWEILEKNRKYWGANVWWWSWNLWVAESLAGAQGLFWGLVRACPTEPTT